MSVEVNETSPKVEFEISKEDRKYIKRIVNNDNINLSEKLDILVDHFDVSEDKMKEMINFLGFSLVESQFSAAKLRTLAKKKRYIISSAQTASPVNLKFLHNIEAYAKFIDAEIGIIATRYRNPTSTWKEEGDVWDENTHKYLIASRQFVHNDVVVLADLKIQATSPNPTNGIELFGDGASCIVGAPRIEMRSVPVLPSQKQKFLYSTGSVTTPNFTDTVAGGKAGEHHSYGFVIVEIESDDVVHLRSVSADSEGNFNDLIYRVEDNTVRKEEVKCLVWGDSHFAQKDEYVTKAFRKLCSDLGISISVLHDVWDSQSMNVHTMKSPTTQYKLHREGKASLQNELDQMYSELEWFEKNMKRTIVVGSNHDDMLDRAIDQSDWKDMGLNAKLFVDMIALKLSGEAEDGIIPYFINKKFKNVTALSTNDSWVLHDVELALHGHKGANGAKGNIRGFSRLCVKSTIGHAHSPSIIGGTHQVGVSCALDHGYNKGLSGWAYAGSTLNKRGKRQMIILNRDTLTYTTLY